MTRAALSRKLCVLWQWLKPNGELKDMTCRVALARMHSDGLIVLPPSRLPAGRRGRPNFPPTPASDPQTVIGQPVHALGPLSLRVVQGTAQSRLWNEYVARYHYLGYTPMSGAQLLRPSTSEDQPLCFVPGLFKAFAVPRPNVLRD